MAIFLKGASWSEIKKIFLKGSSSWSDIAKVYLRTAGGWQVVWPFAGPRATTKPYITISASPYTRIASGNKLEILSSYRGNRGIWDANQYTMTGYDWEFRRYASNIAGTTYDVVGSGSQTDSTMTTALTGAPPPSITLGSTRATAYAYDNTWLSFWIKAKTTDLTVFTERSSAETGVGDQGLLLITRKIPTVQTAPTITISTPVNATKPMVDGILTAQVTFNFNTLDEFKVPSAALSGSGLSTSYIAYGQNTPKIMWYKVDSQGNRTPLLASAKDPTITVMAGGSGYVATLTDSYTLKAAEQGSFIGAEFSVYNSYTENNAPYTTTGFTSYVETTQVVFPKAESPVNSVQPFIPTSSLNNAGTLPINTSFVVDKGTWTKVDTNTKYKYLVQVVRETAVNTVLVAYSLDNYGPNDIAIFSGISGNYTDGTYMAKVTVTATNDGVPATTTAPVYYYISSKVTASISIPAGNKFSNSTFTVTFTVSNYPTSYLIEYGDTVTIGGNTLSSETITVSPANTLTSTTSRTISYSTAGTKTIKVTAQPGSIVAQSDVVIIDTPVAGTVSIIPSNGTQVAAGKTLSPQLNGWSTFITSYEYRWYFDNVLTGTTSETYVASSTPSDCGKTIKVEVRGNYSGLTTAWVMSSSYELVPDKPNFTLSDLGGGSFRINSGVTGAGGAYYYGTYEYTNSSGTTITASVPITGFSVAKDLVANIGLVSVTLFAYNSAVTSTRKSSFESTTKQITLAANAPGQVTGLTATDNGTSRAYNNGRIDLSWTAPNDGGAPISGYKIERSLNGTTYTTLVATTGSSATSYSDTSLTSGQIYYYKVSAINSAGTGTASTAANATATTVPQAPTLGTITTINKAFSVAFTAGATGGKALNATPYTVTATSTSGNITNTGSSSPILINNPVHNATYTVAVTASNANGTSASSASSSTLYGVNIGAPTITSTSATTTSITINFTKGTNSTATRVYLGGSLDGSTTGTSYTFTATADTSYSVVLKGTATVNAVLYEGDSASTTVGTKLTTPTLSTTTPVTGGFTLTIDNYTSANSYTVSVSGGYSVARSLAQITVSGMPDYTDATVSVTASRSGFTDSDTATRIGKSKGVAPTGGTVSAVSGNPYIGQTVSITKTDATGAPAPTYNVVWRIANGGTGGSSFTGGSILQSSTSMSLAIPSLIPGTSISTEGYALRAEVTWTNGVSPDQTVTSNAGTIVVAYLVTYDGNGNTGGTAPASQYKIKNQTLTLATNSGNLTKTDRVFGGWNTALDGTGTNYAAGGSYTGNASLSLWAKWNLITYAINYYPNAGSDTVTNMPFQQTKTKDVSINLSTNVPSRAGYTFRYWQMTGGALIAYQPGELYTTNAQLDLNAIWAYQVTWDATTNGGTAISPLFNLVTPGSSITAPTPAARTGYTFNGWYSAASGGFWVTGAGQPYTPTANITLYAQWSVITYTVAYDKNTTATVSSMPANEPVASGAFYQVSNNTPTRTDGPTFSAWNTAANGSGTYYNRGDGFTVTGNVGLYAIWNVPNATLSAATRTSDGFSVTITNYNSTYSYSVTTTAGSVSRNGSSILVTGLSAGASATISVIVTIGGNSSTASTTTASALPALPATPTGFSATTTRTDGVNLTWTAVSGADSYEIYWNIVGGSAPAANTPADFATTSTSYLDTGMGYGVSRDYWVRSRNAAGTSAWSSRVTGTRATATYTVTWNANGGSVSPTSSTFSAGGSVTTPTPTRSGYTFVAWRDTPSLDYTYTVGAGVSWSPPSQNITMYARWTANPSGTAPSTPTGLTNSYSSGPSWTGSWTASTGTTPITYYWTLNQSQTNGGAITATQSGSTTNTTFTQAMTAGNGLWAYFTVYASNTVGTSGTATSGWA